MFIMKAILLAAAGSMMVGRARAQDTTPAGPTQPGTISTCNKWYTVKNGDSCATVESQFGITLAQFLSWNPAVSSDCTTNFWVGDSYCVGVGSSSATKSVPTVTSPPGPTMTGEPANCNNWYLVQNGDSCATVESKFGITLAQFLAWNPAVSSDCATNFWVGEAYCVGVGGPPVSTTSSSSSTKSVPVVTSPPGPTMTGEPPNCNNWYLIKDGDSCGTVEAAYGITHEQFLEWNPAVSSDCATNFWLGEAYCVGVGPLASGSTTTKSSTSTTTSSSINTSTTPYSTRYPVTNWTISSPTVGTQWPPTQTQAGQPSYCNYWHLVQGGDTCAGIASMYSTWMTLADL